MLSRLILLLLIPNAVPATKSSLKSFRIGLTDLAFGTISSIAFVNSLPRSSLSNPSITPAFGASFVNAFMTSFCVADI